MASASCALIIIMNLRTYICVVYLLVVMDNVRGFSVFRDLIPNGRRVPHPCGEEWGSLTAGRWAAVGHIMEDGGGRLNAFGEDFLRSHEKWTVGLCQMDSDGDGRTNGEELGDPECVWRQGYDTSLPATGHPGVAEPVTEAFCDDD